jgi:DNA-binding beta-propeller fold protein YncE
MSSKTELKSLLQTNFTSISRIGIAFTSSLGNSKMFLDLKSLFLDAEVKEEPFSENMQFLIDVIKQFKVQNIDFLACDTLNYSNWTNYYQMLTLNTGVIIGASNDQTGNIKYGGDWLMESTGQDIELIYFTKSIEYYTFLLDNPSWATSVQGLWGPFGIATNNGYLYVTNADDTISKILISNPNTYTASWATSTQGLNGPRGIAIDNGYLYVTNNYDSTISKILISNPNTYTASWATSTQGLNDPRGIAIDNGYLYVTNADDTISKILISNPNTYTASWATSVQGLNGSQAIAIDNGYFYVSNAPNSTISKILISDPNTYTASYATSTQGLDGPNGIAINNGYLYVANNGNSTISKILISNPNTYNATWATSVQGLNYPLGIAIDNGYLYDANDGNNTIAQISLPSVPLVCFKENSKILTDEGYVPIQDLRKGDLVKTLLHDYKPIVMIGKRVIIHSASKERIKDQLYKCASSEYPEIFESLIITGCHSILVDGFKSEEQRTKVIEVNGDTFVTDGKYRLPACVDDRSSVYKISGSYTIYHLALENDDYYGNYGIYANGLLVETCSKRCLNELSNMDLIE